jgi:hypothetical protein
MSRNAFFCWSRNLSVVEFVVSIPGMFVLEFSTTFPF